MNRSLLPIAVSLIVLLSACGGDDSNDAATVAATATSAPTSEPTVAPQPTATVVPDPTAEPDPTPTPEPPPFLRIEASGLPALGGGALYEAWVIVDDAAVSVGTFASFDGGVDLEIESTLTASAVVITIEVDDDPAPSATHVLAGPVADTAAELTTADVSALGLDFADARGDYILGTPTDGNGPAENERAGVWWTFIPRAQSLFLPELPAGWSYEGWQVIGGIPVSTGTFRTLFGAVDDADPFSGPQPGPPFPGEDFLVNAPDGLTFPVDLRGSEVVITVEPSPDDSPDPYSIVPLRGTVPDDAADHTSYPVDNVSDSLPVGTATFG